MARPTQRARTLSQNFLTDRAVADRVARLAAPDRGDPPLLLEVGAPARGALTEPLARRSRELHAYEIDPRLVPGLRARFARSPHVHVVAGDFLTARPPRTPFSVAGNVPFSRTADIVDWCLSAPGLTDATLITQLEYARKRTGDYGRWSLLTVLTWPRHEWRLLGRVGRHRFRPAPRVDAGILRVERRPTPLLTAPPAVPGRTWSSWASRASAARCTRPCAGPTRGAGWTRRSGPRGSIPVCSSARSRPTGGCGCTRSWRDEAKPFARDVSSRVRCGHDQSPRAHRHVLHRRPRPREPQPGGDPRTRRAGAPGDVAIPPLLADKVAEAGAEPKLWNSTLPGPDADPEASGSTLLDNVEPFLDDAVQSLPQLAEAYEGDEPDLVRTTSPPTPPAYSAAAGACR
ncbi:Ribosomal RNA small subunit methyltransferase A [Streptomyces violaceorubidus]